MLLRNTLRLIPEHFYTLLQDWATTSTRDHERILRALRKGDAEAVRKASSNHVQQAGKMLIEYFNEQGFWDNPNGKR
jgi:DNA-binding GntR family transcriptional regulator